jgi:hypothetical protein
MWTDLGNDKYIYDITIDKYAPALNWYASSIIITDKKSNEIHIGTIGGSPGLGSYYVEGSTGDGEAPVVHSMNVAPGQVLQGDTLTVNVNITDNFSGVDSLLVLFSASYINILMDEPEVNEAIIIEEWNANGDWYTAKVVLNDTAVLGTWYASVIYYEDSAENFDMLLPAGGSMASFEVVDDISPCVPVSHTIDTTICNGNSYFAEGALQTESGTYYDTLDNSGCDSVVVTNLTVQSCGGGVSEIENNSISSVKIFPNPSYGQVHIQGFNIEACEVYDYSGNLLKEEKYTEVIDISGLPDGVYILKIVDSSGSHIVKQLILQK